jgi:hypothetical protein
VTFELPDSVNIFGRCFTVRDLPPTAAAEGVIGMAAYHEGNIYIDQTVDLSLALTTLWHEAIHIAQNDLHGQIDEQEARWMSLFVHNLLVNNPEILQSYLKLLGDSQNRRTTPRVRKGRMPRPRCSCYRFARRHLCQ